MVTLMTSRSVVPVTVTVPLLSVAVGPVAASAGVANATYPPAVVAIRATPPANRRRFTPVFNILLRS